MKRLLLIACALFMTLGGVYARQITENEALEKAEIFQKRATSLRLMKAMNTSSPMKLAYTSRSVDENCFYVFNRGEREGYIIVAAEDRANEILGYADDGIFDYNNIPENMKWWLGEYRREIEYLIEHPEIEAKAVSVKALSTDVSPLLTSRWDQGDPYNAMCPMYDNTQRCVTGCVATAMAQIMYYHRWPLRGTGSYSYETVINKKNVTLSADFGNTVYEWDKMTPGYDDNSSQESKDAVATLMSHCGISLDMDYGLASGAASHKVPYALFTYFGYDKGMSYKSRNYYGIIEWESIMRKELDSGRIVQYAGGSSSGAHSFVCDGYNRDGYFHINWGWGGMSNGYFRTTALTPSSQGVGGSDSGYNYSQDMIVGIQKATDNSTESYELCTDSGMEPSVEETTKGNAITLQIAGVWNLGWNNAPIEIALVLYDANSGNEVYRQSQKTVNLEGMTGWKNSNYRIQIPASVSSGNYKLYLCYRVDGTDTWKKFRVAIGESQYVDVTVSGIRVKFVPSSSGIATLKLDEIVQNTKIYKDRNVSISATISNDGSEYYGNVNFVLYNKDTNVKEWVSSNYIVDIVTGGTDIVELYEAISGIDAGEYLLGVVDENDILIGNTIPVTVNDTPTDPILSLTKASGFPDNSNVPKNNIKLSATIQNTGGYFDGVLTAYIFPGGGGYALSTLKEQRIIIDENEIKEVTFEGSFDEGTAGTEYYTYIRNLSTRAYLTPSNFARCHFILGVPTGLDEAAIIDSRVFPNPVDDYVTVESEKAIKRICIYSVLGNLVSDTFVNGSNSKTVDLSTLSAGNYLVLVVTEEGSSVKQIIKK